MTGEMTERARVGIDRIHVRHETDLRWESGHLLDQLWTEIRDELRRHSADLTPEQVVGLNLTAGVTFNCFRVARGLEPLPASDMTFDWPERRDG